MGIRADRGGSDPITSGDMPEIVESEGWYWIRDEVGDLVPWKEVDSASGTSSSWSGQYINDALTAASQAIKAFLSGQSLADARNLSSAEQFQKMAAYALPAGSTTAPGYERGGPAHQLAALQGRPTYTPPPMQTQRVNPAALAQAGQVPSEVMDFINQMLSAADKGRVVTTGGSSSG